MDNTQEVSNFLGIAGLPESISGNMNIVSKLSNSDICKLIPESDQALFADKALILHCDDRPGDRGVLAIVTMPVKLDFCRGHMPGFPILPLGIGGWMLSQAGEILVAHIHTTSKMDGEQYIPLVVETGPVGSKNKDFICPGDVLLVIATLINHRFGIYKVDTEAWVGGQQVVVVPSMTYAVMTLEDLKERYHNGKQR